MIGGSLTEVDDEAVLEELAEIEQMAQDELQLKLPAAPTRIEVAETAQQEERAPVAQSGSKAAPEPMVVAS